MDNFIVLSKEERIQILTQRLEKTEEAAKQNYDYAEAAAICGNPVEETYYRNKYYVLYDEIQKIRQAISNEE